MSKEYLVLEAATRRKIENAINRAVAADPNYELEGPVQVFQQTLIAGALQKVAPLYVATMRMSYSAERDEHWRRT